VNPLQNDRTIVSPGGVRVCYGLLGLGCSTVTHRTENWSGWRQPGGGWTVGTWGLSSRRGWCGGARGIGGGPARAPAPALGVGPVEGPVSACAGAFQASVTFHARRRRPSLGSVTAWSGSGA